MKRWALTALFVVLTGCAAAPPPEPPPPPPPPAAPTADQNFAALTGRYLDEFPQLAPVAATQLGDHRYDAALDDVDTNAQNARLAFAERYLRELAEIPRAALSRANQVDAALLENQLRYDIWQVQTLEEWRWNPLIYTSLAGNAIYSLLARDFAPLPERLVHTGARLDALPRFLEQVRSVLVPERVPRVHAETAIRQNSGLTTLIDSVVVPRLAELPAEQRAGLEASIDTARNAIEQHQLWLERLLLPQAKGDFRLGAELYDAKLAFALASPLTREQIRDRAMRELTGTRAEMYGIARVVLADRKRAPSTPVAPTERQQQRAIEAALELAYADQPARDEVFEVARRSYTETEHFVKTKDLVSVFNDPLEIIPMPEFQRGVALAYCDPPGPLDTGLKTFYAVSPIPENWSRQQVRSFLREYNTRSIHNLTVHEAMPGHYLQLMHANRYESPLRAVLASGPFIEGWAVYAERLMVDQGYYDNDPLMRLVQLKWYLRSIGNALLDQAVHVDGMKREAAMRLMMRDTFQEEREAAAKWVRVQLSSAQLPTYFVGAQEHFALRAEAEQRAGADFDLKQYHDKLLSFGSPPVRYARALMFDLPIE
ncbi:MAG: DUF885 domain-containing protein [Steroidobacteraceae bacterium]|nr:DUF885 domain-containing protein [Steroidobacteraceae bacterium]